MPEIALSRFELRFSGWGDIPELFALPILKMLRLSGIPLDWIIRMSFIHILLDETLGELYNYLGVLSESLNP